jgi:hypothetical protein
MLSGHTDPVKDIEYSLNLGDADAFLRYSAENTVESSLWWLGLLLGLGLMFYACIGSFTGASGDLFLTPALVALVFCLLALLRKKWVHSLTSLRPEGQDVGKFLAERRLRVSPEALTHATEFSAETLSWKAIDKIAVTRDHAFLFFSRTAAYILPRRAFATDADFQDFVHLARRYHAPATEKPEEGITVRGEHGVGKSEHIRPSHRPDS